MAKYIEGVAFSNYKFVMTDVNSPTIGKTGLSPSVEISNDAGTFASSTGSASELQSGWYILNTITVSEMISGSISIVAMASGANDWRDVIFPDTVNLTSIKSDTAQSVIDISSLDTRVSSIGTRVSSMAVEVSSIENAVLSGVNITNSAAQLVWTIPISFFETNVLTTARSPAWAIEALVNKFDYSGADLQFYRIDDSTVLFSITTSSDANADLIVSGDTI